MRRRQKRAGRGPANVKQVTIHRVGRRWTGHRLRSDCLQGEMCPLQEAFILLLLIGGPIPRLARLDLHLHICTDIPMTFDHQCHAESIRRTLISHLLIIPLLILLDVALRGQTGSIHPTTSPCHKVIRVPAGPVPPHGTKHPRHRSRATLECSDQHQLYHWPRQSSVGFRSDSATSPLS